MATFDKPISKTMKRVAFILLIVLLQSVLPLSAQEQKIQLKLQEGYEYVFEQTEKSYFKLFNGLERNNLVNYRKYRIEVKKVIDGNEIIAGVTHLKNNEKRFDYYYKTFQTTDFFFPAFSEPEVFDDLGTSEKQLEAMLCMFEIQFSLNLKTREVKILGREELLETFYEKLIERGYYERDVSDIIKYLDEEKLDLKKDLVSFLLWFHNSEKTSKSIKDNQQQEEFKVQEAGKEFIKFGDADLENIVPGKWYKKYWLNTENGIITEYSSIKKDTINYIRQNITNYTAQWKVQEKEFKFLSSKRIQPELLTISGRIQYPLSNKVYIRFLDEPYGTELKKHTVFLDEHGIFTTSFEFKHKGLVFIEHENNNRHNPPVKIVLYAEPGDSLHFEIHGEKQLWNIIFHGDRIAESELIQEYRNQMELKKYSSGYSNLIFDQEIYFGYAIFEKDGKSIGNISGNITDEELLQYIELTDIIANRYQYKIDSDILKFIKNETHLYFIEGLFKFVGRSESWLNYFVDFENYDDFDFQKMKQKLSEIDIPSMYNAYGLYSRKCIESYLEYTFQTTKKVEGMERLVSELRSYGNYYDIEQNVQFDKLIISGSPLYREIVSYLNGVITYKQPYPLEVKFYSLKTAQRYMELILRRSADNELNYKVKLLLDQHKKVLSTDYVPEISFFDTNKNEVSYKNFTGQKPTVFYFSDDWVGQRYQMEEYVKENKDVNFVMVTEGNNFREWKEYQDHAEPLVTHLFFNNDSITFKELFFRTDVFFVFDKKGKLASIERGLKEAYNKAKASLEYPKFEWNQSILRNIILVLGIILFVVIFTLLIVRLQAQRKLKKENQLRRLRELELTAIRSQMNPHFLFNSLNSVQNLIQQNKGKEAHVYLSDFAGLIRKVLKNSEKQESSLAEELEMTEQYIKLEKLRFDFDYTVTVDE
ncbi:MAG: histidine kinase, partial [Prolixibacteraceae bacterium]|nr:histidine kinase [Prolixibacteraceae bacterium]